MKLINNHLLQVTTRFIVVGIIASGLIILTYLSWLYLLPFILAMLFSAFLQPFIQLLDRHLHIPRTAAVLFVLLLFSGLTGGITTLLMTEIVKGVQYLASGVPGHFTIFIKYSSEKATDFLHPILLKAEKLTEKLSFQQQLTLEEYSTIAQQKISETSIMILNHFFEGIGVFLTSLPSSFAFVFITLLSTFFICKDWERIIAFIKRSAPPILSDRFSIFRSEFIYTIKGLIRAQCILVIVSTSLIAAGLFILGAPHPLSITFLAALVDFIPYIGTGIIFIPWIVYQFFTGNFIMTIGLSVLYIVVMLTRQTLEPKLLADHFGVPPIVLIMSLFLGYQLFGGLGVVISPIALMMIQTLNKAGVLQEVWDYISGKA